LFGYELIGSQTRNFFRPEINDVFKFTSIGLFAILLLPAALIAQSDKSAIGGEASLWAGGEVSVFNPDFDCASNIVFNCKYDLYGGTALFDFNVRPRWGVEGEARWLHWGGNEGEVESNYLIGGRYKVYRINRFSLWAKVLVGGGWITTPGYPNAGSLKGSYFTYVPGAIVDYRLSRRLILRADYEYQLWPSFAGPPSYNSSGQLVNNANGLTPNGVSLGVTYRFLGQ
jgi:hypothetical protein